MRIILTFCLSIVYCLNISGQEHLHFKNSKHPVKLPFKLINNLIILPVKVNGIELNFLVDTGVEETILFSLDDKKEIQLHDVEKIKLKGLGTREPVEGLKAYKKHTICCKFTIHKSGNSSDFRPKFQFFFCFRN